MTRQELLNELKQGKILYNSEIKAWALIDPENPSEVLVNREGPQKVMSCRWWFVEVVELKDFPTTMWESFGNVGELDIIRKEDHAEG